MKHPSQSGIITDLTVVSAVDALGGPSCLKKEAKDSISCRGDDGHWSDWTGQSCKGQLLDRRRSAAHSTAPAHAPAPTSLAPGASTHGITVAGRGPARPF